MFFGVLLVLAAQISASSNLWAIFHMVAGQKCSSSLHRVFFTFKQLLYRCSLECLDKLDFSPSVIDSSTRHCIYFPPKSLGRHSHRCSTDFFQNILVISSLGRFHSAVCRLSLRTSRYASMMFWKFSQLILTQLLDRVLSECSRKLLLGTVLFCCFSSRMFRQASMTFWKFNHLIFTQLLDTPSSECSDTLDFSPPDCDSFFLLSSVFPRLAAGTSEAWSSPRTTPWEAHHDE